MLLAVAAGGQQGAGPTVAERNGPPCPGRRRRLPVTLGPLPALGLLSLVLAVRAAVLTTVPAWPWLLLLAALLALAVFVELPLRVGNRRVQVAGLCQAALLVSLSLHTRVGVALVAAAVTVVRDSSLHRARRSSGWSTPPCRWGPASRHSPSYRS